MLPCIRVTFFVVCKLTSTFCIRRQGTGITLVTLWSHSGRYFFGVHTIKNGIG
jgi:hypothetical protein